MTGTIFISSLWNATVGSTKTHADIVLLSEPINNNSCGQVISVSGGSDAAGFDAELEGFCLTLSRDGGKLSVGGNYTYNELDPVARVSTAFVL